MKSICKTILFLVFAGLYSCEIEKSPLLLHPAEPVCHISFYDHKTGEKITGLEATLITYDWGNNYRRPGIALKSDINGVFSFDLARGSSFNQYVKILDSSYVDAIYRVDDFSFASGFPTHTKEGSNGPNVVVAEFQGKKDNDFYFKADLYRKVEVELHIIQITDFSDSLELNFNTSIYGSDPSNPENYFETNDFFGDGLRLKPGKKIDTTVRVFGFGDYSNKISWSIYNYELMRNSIDERGRKMILIGDLEEKIFPSDAPAKITITF